PRARATGGSEVVVRKGPGRVEETGQPVMPGREAPLPFRNHLPPPSHGHRSPPPDGRPRTPRLPCPRLPEEHPQHEKAWAKKLAVLIRTRRGRQGFSRVEL